MPHPNPTHPDIHGTANWNIFPGTQSSVQQLEPKWAKKKLLVRKKVRRGWGGRNKRKNQNFTILAANANGLKGKFDSLKNSINHFKPSCILIQESKLRNKGSLKLKGYQVFELNRQGMGGALFTAIDVDLSPVLVSAGNSDT